MSDEWSTTRTVAYIWWCGDYDCDCTQPRIEEITPNHEAGRPAIRRKILWEGTYCSEDTTPEQREAQKRELEEAAKAYGITVTV